MNGKRILALDGFRAIAVLGVLWAHIWMFFGNPAFTVARVNVAQPISFFGTGVDLFFVISGFCMYLMHHISDNEEVNWKWSLEYLSKRWFRIAPAFYLAIVAYGMINVSFVFWNFDWAYALKNAFFIRNFFSEPTQYAPHFWSLSTEWQFYLVLPFILLIIQKFSFAKSIPVLLAICLVSRLGIALFVAQDDFNVINYSLLNRLIEFILGIIVAHFYINRTIPWIESSTVVIIGALIAFSGRVLLSAYFQYRTDWLGVMAKTLDIFLLASGYALVILSTLSSQNLFTKLLESKVMTKIGKYSYSMYLWHWIIALQVSALVKWMMPSSNQFILVNIAFLISIGLLFPISALSYKISEAPYFRKRLSYSKSD